MTNCKYWNLFAEYGSVRYDEETLRVPIMHLIQRPLFTD